MAQYKSLGKIDNVVPGSPAARVGIMPGDKLLAINGVPVSDVVGYQFHQVNERLAVQVERQGTPAPLTFTIRKPEQQDLGLEFVDPTFDGIKRCNNHCPFCFVDQNAPGLRRSLDIKDDDFRYSFLYGGFITLTNLREQDWQRVADEGLSPLYVSVHATEPEMRRQLLGNPRAPEIVPQLQRLGTLGAQVHTQLVLCPNLNDGPQLDRSISDLAALYPHVQTVGVVPVGLTKFRRNNHYQIKLPLRPYTPAEAEAVLAQVETWQRKLHRELGTNFVFASDEWYIMTGRETPHARHYEEYPQLENGIGMVRQLLDESRRTARKLPDALPNPVRAIVACGEMAAPARARARAPPRAIQNLDLHLLPIKNTTLEGNVSCSGLLFAEEVAANLQTKIAELEFATSSTNSKFEIPNSKSLIFLPRRMFDFQGIRTLDEWRIETFQERLGVPCIKAEWTHQLLDTIQKAANGEDCWSHTDEPLALTALG
jgi:putative radical SAM enzyme (TIGR03279 family)